jgi:regulatory LuxR family protein
LTNRELAVLLLNAEGKPNAEIGVALFISTKTASVCTSPTSCASSASVPGCKQPRSPSAPDCSHRDSLIIDAVCSPGYRAAPGENAPAVSLTNSKEITIYADVEATASGSL